MHIRKNNILTAAENVRRNVLARALLAHFLLDCAGDRFKDPWGAQPAKNAPAYKLILINNA